MPAALFAAPRIPYIYMMGSRPSNSQLFLYHAASKKSFARIKSTKEILARSDSRLFPPRLLFPEPLTVIWTQAVLSQLPTAAPHLPRPCCSHLTDPKSCHVIDLSPILNDPETLWLLALPEMAFHEFCGTGSEGFDGGQERINLLLIPDPDIAEWLVASGFIASDRGGERPVVLWSRGRKADLGEVINNLREEFWELEGVRPHVHVALVVKAVEIVGEVKSVMAQNQEAVDGVTGSLAKFTLSAK
ncbi:hypothetical protein HK101_009028 [Irineochytrium annulatum]|nr:hypothetical protein HK101_009028 [Irineochytrium annulatum]